MSLSGAICGLVFGLAAAGPGDPVTVSDEVGARQPQAVIDDRGRIHVAYGSGEKVRYTVSSDGGRSFAEPKTVGAVEALALGMRRGPRIAVTPGAIVVSAIGHRGGDLLAWRSTDDGKTWAGPTRVNAVPGSAREGLHAMAGRPDGTVFCAWLDLRDQGTQVFGARSMDAGLSWDRDRLVYQSPDRTVCECCHPSAAFGPDGTLHVMWRNHIRGARDLFFATSSDRGESFGRARKLGEGTWLLDACPMDGGAIAAGPDGAVETVWRRDDAVFAAKPGGPERRLGSGQQPWAAWGPAGLIAAWLGRSGEGQPDALWVLAPGSPQPRLLARHARSPVLAAAPDGTGPVVIFWESDQGIFSANAAAD